MNILTTDRNKGGQSKLFEFTNGIEFDKRLAPFEIGVQKAWARALTLGGYLSADECADALRLLDLALSKMKDGSFEWKVQDEDIHMNLERFMTDEAGDLGKRIHMGRSRNDLVATTLRLYSADVLHDLLSQVKSLAAALCDIGERTVDIIVPGTTHQQHGQPVSFGHIAASHAQAFLRDLKRIESAGESCLEYMPLGSAALSGTSLNVDLDLCVKELGFGAPSENSYDAVGDRDYMIEAMDAFASLAVHIGRLCEDMIYWSSTAVGLVKLPADWSTGSSIMPNKRNPDVAELARARSARIVSLTSAAHSILKSVPTSYGSDLHELKKTFMMSCDEVNSTFTAMIPFIEGISVDKVRAGELLMRGHVLATEIADALSSEGMSFRDAYRKTAQLVELAESKGLQVHELDKVDFSSVLPESGLGFTDTLSFETAVAKRDLPGGTSPDRVRTGIRCVRERIGTFVTRP